MKSLQRIRVIAGITFTQLVRMKVFGFLALFAVLLISAHFFQLPHTYGPESAAEEELRMLKSSAMGAMTLFATLFAIAGTALLIPKDVEDRTLYTILCKPVPRFDYLSGKFLGIVGTVFLALLIMDILMVVVLQGRTSGVLAERMAVAEFLKWSPDLVSNERDDVLRHGATWSLQIGVLAIFLKSVVAAGVALLISTFSTSTLFTIIVGVLIYVIGHFSGVAREFWLNQQLEVSSFTRAVSHVFSVVLPDFRLFNVIDAAIAGQSLSGSVAMELAGITVLYSLIYLILSWFVFSKKEF